MRKIAKYALKCRNMQKYAIRTGSQTSRTNVKTPFLGLSLHSISACETCICMFYPTLLVNKTDTYSIIKYFTTFESFYTASVTTEPNGRPLAVPV